jgi:cytochrome P450
MSIPQTRPLPPKVEGFPLIGALPGLLKDRFDFLEAARRKHGDIYTLDVGVSQAIILTHPRHVQHVMVDHQKNYSKNGPMWDSMRTFLGNGLPVSEGEYWKRQRRMVQPAFHHQRLVAVTDRMVEVVDEHLRKWEQAARTGEDFNVARSFASLTMDVLVRTMFGSGLSEEDSQRAAREVTYIIDYMLFGMMTNNLPEWAPIPGRNRYREAIRTVDEIVFQVIEQGRKGGAEDNLLTLMLNMVDAETGERMSDAQIRDEAVGFFVAGFETTAVSLSWAFHLLTQYPEVARRLQQEVDGVLGQRAPVFADLRQLPYSRNVFQEALRLYSPSYWIARQTVEEDTLDGFRIPAGSTMGVFSYLVHRNPAIWDEPLRFDPDRFSPERSEGRHKQAWLPFGAGTRTCIGKEFSLMEGQLILSRVAQRFEVSAIPGREVKLHIGLSMRAKDGVWLRVKER